MGQSVKLSSSDRLGALPSGRTFRCFYIRIGRC
nr:MAG TPA: hypothetical protein [Caudoviricetes sp.]